MRLTDKFYRDCTCYFYRDNTQEWKDFEEEHRLYMDIDNRSSDKNMHTITFNCYMPVSGNRINHKHFSAVFSMIGRSFIEVKQNLGIGKMLKTDDVEQLLKCYTKFITDMIKHGFLEVAE